MVKIEILASNTLSPLYKKVYETIISNGFNVVSEENINSESDSILTVFFLEKLTKKLIFDIGYRMGAKRKILLIGNDVELKSINLPLGDIKFVSIYSNDIIQKIVLSLREILGFEIPSHKELENIEQFILWLAEDWNRLYNLDWNSFQTLVALFFEFWGMEMKLFSHMGKTNIWIKKPEWNAGGIVSLHVSTKNSLCDLGKIQEISTLCSSKKSMFAFLISNTKFTKAAHEWAKRCLPAVHLIDGEDLKYSLLYVMKNRNRLFTQNMLKKYALENSLQNKLGLELKDDFNFKLFNLFNYDKTKIYKKMLKFNINDIEANESKKNDEVAKYISGICVVLALDSANEIIEYQVKKLVKKCDEIGKKVKVLSKYETSFNDWSEIISTSRNIILIFEPKGQQTQLGSFQKRIMQLISNNCDTKSENVQTFYFLKEDNLLNRLSIPGCIKRGIFINPVETWVNHFFQNYLVKSEEKK